MCACGQWLLSEVLVREVDVAVSLRDIHLPIQLPDLLEEGGH